MAESPELLRAGELEVLELMTADAPLETTLDRLARVFEHHAEGMLASVLLVEDGARVRHVAAPGLPQSWARLVDGQPIGPNRGSCGTAAYLKEPVIAVDIASDPRWAIYREAALAHDLRACWSTPIFGANREVLGTFAFYYSKPREPTARLLELAAQASHLATLAIRQHRHKVSLEELSRLREREQLHSVFELAPCAVIVTQGDLVRYANQKAVELLGVHIGNEAGLAYVGPADRARIEMELTEGRAVLDRELRGHARDGRLLDLLATFRSIVYEGKPSTVAYVVDLSRVKDAERELQQLSESLIRAKESAESANVARSRFYAGVSHDLRTPLTAILGFGQLLLRDAELTARDRERLDQILGSGTDLLGLVNRLIDVSKNEVGRAVSGEALAPAGRALDWLSGGDAPSLRPMSLAPSAERIAALGEGTRAALRAALTLGDIDAAKDVLARLDAREHPVLLDLRRRLDDFDLEGLLACL
jgi:signal transduction histidine kinase